MWECPYPHPDKHRVGSRLALRRHLTNVHDADLVRRKIRRGEHVDEVVVLSGEALAVRQEAVRRSQRHDRKDRPRRAAAVAEAAATPPPPPSYVSSAAAVTGPRPVAHLLPGDTASDLSSGQDMSVFDLPSIGWRMPELTDIEPDPLWSTAVLGQYLPPPPPAAPGEGPVPAAWEPSVTQEDWDLECSFSPGVLSQGGGIAPEPCALTGDSQAECRGQGGSPGSTTQLNSGGGIVPELSREATVAVSASPVFQRDVSTQADVSAGMWRPRFDPRRAAELTAVAMQASPQATSSTIQRRVALWLSIPATDFVSRDILLSVVEAAVHLERLLAHQLTARVQSSNAMDPSGFMARLTLATELSWRTARPLESWQEVPDDELPALVAAPEIIDISDDDI